MGIKVTYIGHSTLLIESGGIALLTDPVFAQNILFARRLAPLTNDPGRLPRLDAVLISHTHLDHFDITSFKYIDTKTPVIIPEGSFKTVSRNLTNPVVELGTWASYKISDGLTVNAVPARHSGLSPMPRPYSMALGYVIELDGRKIYFAGDTGYGGHFKEIASAHAIDHAFLPIGSYSPSFFKRWHMDPVETVQAFIDLKAKKMSPIHWGTFRLSLEKPDEPLAWLEKEAAERGIGDGLKIIQHGGIYEF